MGVISLRGSVWGLIQRKQRKPIIWRGLHLRQTSISEKEWDPHRAQKQLNQDWVNVCWHFCRSNASWIHPNGSMGSDRSSKVPIGFETERGAQDWLSPVVLPLNRPQKGYPQNTHTYTCELEPNKSSSDLQDSSYELDGFSLALGANREM